MDTIMKTECVNKMLSTILIILYPKFDLFVKISQKVCNHVNTPFLLNTHVTYILLHLRIKFDHCLKKIII